MKYYPAPQVVTSRQPPQWFSDRLKEIDPLLRMEWWNPHPIMGPTWRLIRVMGDGRWAHVEWIQYEDQMRAIIPVLFASDTHRHGTEIREYYREQYIRTAKAIEEDRLATERKVEEQAYRTGEDILRAHEYRWRNRDDKIVSIPGVNVRKSWNE